MNDHKQQLLDLLAIINGDGGHYVGEHGLEKAISDAMDLISHLRVALDQSKEREKRECFAIQMAAAWRASEEGMHPDGGMPHAIAKKAVADADALIAALEGRDECPQSD